MTVPALNSENNRELFYFSHTDFVSVKITVKCCTLETVQHPSVRKAASIGAKMNYLFVAQVLLTGCNFRWADKRV